MQHFKFVNWWFHFLMSRNRFEMDKHDAQKLEWAIVQLFNIHNLLIFVYFSTKVAKSRRISMTFLTLFSDLQQFLQHLK